ncbi:hypothetical protein C8J56DRAFT_591157 [Mycena floridula]|nr:hypothetical protein C8J56DRAFT_591157 [Mycena floridula]
MSSSPTLSTSSAEMSPGDPVFQRHPKIARICPICHKSFNHPSNLQAHMNIHTGDTPFQCPHPNCDRAFNVKSNMKRHYRMHLTETEAQSLMKPRAPATPYKCHHCSKIFNHPSNLRVHLNSHTAETSFDCVLCDKSFNVRSNLTRHQRSKHPTIMTNKGSIVDSRGSVEPDPPTIHLQPRSGANLGILRPRSPFAAPAVSARLSSA